MILLCDEMMGRAIPDSLRAIGYPVTSMHRTRMLGRKDPDWLTVAGRRGWLVLSKNKRMLLVEEERQTIIDKTVGIIFLTQDLQDLPRLLKLLLTKWSWICAQDQRPRPFATFLSTTGRLSDTFRLGRKVYQL